MKVAITTTISQEYHDLAKANNIKWNEALARGIRAIVDEPKMRAELEILQAGNQKLHSKLAEVSAEVWALQQKAGK
jgi:hypothetical protein